MAIKVNFIVIDFLNSIKSYVISFLFRPEAKYQTVKKATVMKILTANSVSEETIPRCSPGEIGR